MAFSMRLRSCILLLIVVIVVVNIASSEAKPRQSGSRISKPHRKPPRPQPPRRPPTRRPPKPPPRPPPKPSTRPPTRRPAKPPPTPPPTRPPRPPPRPSTRTPTRKPMIPPTKPPTIAPTKPTTKTTFRPHNNSYSGTSDIKHETNINSDFLNGERSATHQHNKNDLTKKPRPDIQEDITKVNHGKLDKDPSRDTHSGSGHVDNSKPGHFSEGKGNNSTRQLPMDKNQSHNVMKGNHTNNKNLTKDNFNKHGFNTTHQSPKDVDQHHKIGKINQTNKANDNSNKHVYNITHSSPKVEQSAVKNLYGQFNVSRIPSSRDRNSTHHVWLQTGTITNPAGSSTNRDRPSHGGEPLHQYAYVPGQTIVVMNPQTQSPQRGFSDILQEALVRGIARATVNEIFGTGHHSDHHSHGGSSGNSVRTSPPHTTFNNVNITTVTYYINDTDDVSTNDKRNGSISSRTNMPQGPQPPTTNIQQNGNSTLPGEEFRYAITDDDLKYLTQSLFTKDDMNTSQYVRMNLQTQSLGPNTTARASEPLLHVHPDAYKLPTIQALRKLFDNYEFDSVNREFMDQEKLEEENAMLDVFLHTDIMYTAMRWLANNTYIEPDEFAWKDALYHIWMSKVNGATSGFERIFLAEKYPGPSIVGGQNWIYFDYQESLKRITYLNYVNQIKLDDRGSSLIKFNYKFDDVVKQDMTMLVGTPPELEMALYTICYYVRLNDPCLVWLGDTPFVVYAHAFRDHGKDRLDLGLLYS